MSTLTETGVRTRMNPTHGEVEVPAMFMGCADTAFVLHFNIGCNMAAGVIRLLAFEKSSAPVIGSGEKLPADKAKAIVEAPTMNRRQLNDQFPLRIWNGQRHADQQ